MPNHENTHPVEIKFPIEEYEKLYTISYPGNNPYKPVLGERKNVTIAPNLAALLKDPDILVATAVDEEGSMIGFSFAMPINRLEPDRYQEAHETAYIYHTGITPDRQGEGRVGSLMDDMFQQIRDRGFRYVERDCAVDNGYADKVQKTYGRAIIASYDHDRFVGPGLQQRFFRIDLNLVPIHDKLDI